MCSELTFFFFVILLSFFTEPKPDKFTSIIGWLMIGMIILSMLCSWGFVIVQQITEWKKKKLKEKEKEKEKEKNKNKIKYKRKVPMSEIKIKKKKEKEYGLTIKEERFPGDLKNKTAIIQES